MINLHFHRSARRLRGGETRRGGFTLIEVSLAMAVCVIGLIALLALFPHALQSARDAADNTLAATVVQDIFSFLRAQKFSSISGGGSTVQYYDSSGNVTNVANAYYQVALDRVPITAPAPFSALPLVRVTATVVWPAKSAAPINTNYFVTQIAQYDK